MSAKVRVWAHNNAYTLIFLASMFAITWVVTLWVKYG